MSSLVRVAQSTKEGSSGRSPKSVPQPSAPEEANPEDIDIYPDDVDAELGG